jgi:hypothetical protein
MASYKVFLIFLLNRMYSYTKHLICQLNIHIQHKNVQFKIHKIVIQCFFFEIFGNSYT